MSESPDGPRTSWHDGKTKIYGVFEGGGAKGIAYEGALAALCEKGYWFRGVAGASAGALTAALIAADVKPSDLRPDMLKILDILSPGSDAGQLRVLARALWRVRRHGAALDRERLITWLDERLRLAVRGHCEAGDVPVTFEELFAHSEIELCVVAADLSRRQPVVFSRQTTKHCQVAHAVVASCSIPFVFDGARLVFPFERIAAPEEAIDLFSTVVDGGVLTNFPMFAFQDSVFRAFAGLQPFEIHDPVVGFLLSDVEPGNSAWLNEMCRMSLPAVTFADANQKSIRPLEAIMFGDEAPVSRPKTVRARVGGWVSSLAAQLTGWTKADSEPRWPPAQGVVLKNIITTVDRTLVTAHGMFGVFTAMLLMMVAVIAIGIAATFAAIVVQAIPEARSPLGWFTFVSVAVVCVSIIVTSFVAVAILLGSLPVLNWLLLKPLRNQGYGLARTFFAAPSPPPWAAKRPDVIALTIGFGVSTLTFSLKEQTQVAPLVKQAYDESILRLEAMQRAGGVLAVDDAVRLGR